MARRSISNEERIVNFFSLTSTSQEACHAKALSLTTGPLTPVPSQGHHSYSLYATSSKDQIIQFRLASHFIDLDKQSLVESILGDLVPRVTFEGELGDDDEDSETGPVCVYLMNRLAGVIRSDLSSNTKAGGMDSSLPKNMFAGDMAHFLARSWMSPQPTTESHRAELKSRYFDDLQILARTLPEKFQPVIEACITSLDSILSLPFVLEHPNLRNSNILVDPQTGRLTGVLDWSEVNIAPFGMSLHTIEIFATDLDMPLELLQSAPRMGEERDFWDSFRERVGFLNEITLRTIRQARVLGVLMRTGFVGGRNEE